MKSSSSYLGIDFGTTTTIISYYNQKETIILPLRGFRATPSLIQINKDHSVDRWGHHLEGLTGSSDNIFSNFKPDIDQKRAFFDEEIPQKTICFLFLREIKRQLEKEYQDLFSGRIDETAFLETVCGCPALWAKHKQTILLQTLDAVGFPAPVLISEPVGASVYLDEYIREKGISSAVIYDLGGGTSDISKVTYKKTYMPIPKQIASENLGGRNLDELIARDFHDEINCNRRKKNQPIVPLNDSIRYIAKRCREDLHHNSKCEIETYYCKLIYTEELFSLKSEEVLSEFIRLLLTHLQPSDTKIIMVGGLSSFRFLKERMKEGSLGKRSFYFIDNPQFAIALGLVKSKLWLENSIHKRGKILRKRIEQNIEKTRKRIFGTYTKKVIQESIQSSIAKNWNDLRIWENFSIIRPWKFENNLRNDKRFKSFRSKIRREIEKTLIEQIEFSQNQFMQSVQVSLEDVLEDFSNVTIEIPNPKGFEQSLKLKINDVVENVLLGSVADSIISTCLSFLPTLIKSKERDPLVKLEKEMANKIYSDLFETKEFLNDVWYGHVGKQGLKNQLEAVYEKIWFGESNNGIYNILLKQLIIKPSSK
jgi:hypothetical protein